MLLHEAVMCNVALVTGGFVWRPVSKDGRWSKGPRGRTLCHTLRDFIHCTVRVADVAPLTGYVPSDSDC